MKCTRCDLDAVIKQGHSWLCPKHYRFGQMRVSAKRHGKAVPSLDEMGRMLPPNLVCPSCNRTMNWRQAEGASTVITLQHDRNGKLRFLCLACNTRHASVENDSFYQIPEGHKRCPRCGENKPLECFCTDNGKRWKNKKSTCKECSALYHSEWVSHNREAYNETRRRYYHARKNAGNPIPR